jgi:hypothetical protein
MLNLVAGGNDDTTVNFAGGYYVPAGQTTTLNIYDLVVLVTGGAGSNELSYGPWSINLPSSGLDIGWRRLIGCRKLVHFS